MLKQRFTKKINIFRKKKIKITKLSLNANTVYQSNRAIFNLVKISMWLKKTYKRFKKRNVCLYINFQNNLIRTYKSKNARMGKGKGQLRRYTIFHMSRVIGRHSTNSALLHRKLRKSFFKTLKCLYLKSKQFL